MLALLTTALLVVGVPLGDSGEDEVFTPACTETTAATQAPRQAFPGMLPGVNNERILDAVHCELLLGNVDEVLFLENGDAVVVIGDERIEFAVPPGKGAWFSAEVAAHGARVHTARRAAIAGDALTVGEASRTSPLGVATLLIVTLLGVVGIVRWWRNRRRGSLVTVGGSGKRRGSDGVPETRFTDVAGCQEAIEDLKEIVDCLLDPDAYERLGARVPRGALLVGPPGTGKTLLARAVAGESGVPFYPVAGSDFVEMYVGVGAKRVREVFEKARRQERAIVFIDEIDAVGRRRNDNVATGGEQELENTLIALLNELDGFRQTGVIVLAATNRPDVLDPALCRPGRLDRRIYVGLPDRGERASILSVHTRGKHLGEVDLAEIAGRTQGMSGAQLEQVCNEAALLAARQRVERIDGRHFHEALEYVAAGRPRRSASVTSEDRLVTAWHEAGHLVASLRQPGADRPAGVSITPRGQASGVTWTVPGDSVLVGRSNLLARLVVALAGRAAEEILLGEGYTAGAADDLARASDLARTMVDRLGMTGRGLSVRQSGSKDSDEAVEELLQDAAAAARHILVENESLLRASIAALLEKSDLDGDDILRLERAHPARRATPINGKGVL